MLGIDAASIDPDSLIAAILRAEVDLMWFGGIGTYVKAASENHIQVGDPANDALRVDGEQLRCKVIGEGANLGVTQAGRIEFALNGGRVNTDFIDNSAGVDCSDNEVNIKIALAGAKRAGRLTRAGRVKLLASMTDEVGEHRARGQSASGAGAVDRPGWGGACDSVVAEVDRDARGGRTPRPPDRRPRRQRKPRPPCGRRPRPDASRARGACSRAPSWCFKASSRRHRCRTIPEWSEELLKAFPAPMRVKFKRDILAHRLRCEIVSTKLANRIVNRLGPIHPFELADEESASIAQVVAAFVAAEQLLGMARVWEAIETTAMPETARIALFDRAAAALATHMADLLRVGGGSTSPSKLVAELEAGVRALCDRTGKLLAAEGQAQSARMRAEYAALGAPAEVAAAVAHLFDIDGAVGLAKLARESGTEVRTVTRAFTDIGARLGLDWAQQTAERLNPSDPWERLLVNGLSRDFQHMRLDFLRRAAKKGDPVLAVERWAEAQAGAIRQFRAMVGRARTATAVAPAMLAQIASQARNLLGR